MPKLPLKIENVINEFVKEIQEILGENLKKVILYGSYARGDYKKNSDIDIMILADIPIENLYSYFIKISEKAYDLELENDIILSPLLKNEERFESWSEAMPFYMNVLKEGAILIG